MVPSSCEGKAVVLRRFITAGKLGHINYINDSGSVAQCSWWGLSFTDVEPVQVSTNGFVKTERHVWVGRSTAVKGP